MCCHNSYFKEVIDIYKYLCFQLKRGVDCNGTCCDYQIHVQYMLHDVLHCRNPSCTSMMAG